MGQAEAGEVTRLLQSWSRGEKQALNELVPLVYRELRRLAAAYIRRERPDHTLQPTGLVHEAYLRLIEQTQVECLDRAKFFIVAANLMRQILVDHARRRLAGKRGGGNQVVLDEAAGAFREDAVDLVELDQALQRLARLDARQGRVVELRFFLGLTEDEIADILDVSPVTVKRDWRIAKAALRIELGGGVRGAGGRL
uniref:RNA polymerase, sigma-24 subunit, ECF subfamily n=1 Tax=Solibacter usitatus (strain Ellin6076) TaxID=234267 RepID=Q01NG1_SOLUE